MLWESITNATIQELIGGIRDLHIEVILANGLYKVLVDSTKAPLVSI